MLATITGTVLAVTRRTTNTGAEYATVYMLQPGRQEPVQAYFATSGDNALQGGEPEQGATITADVLAYADRQGRLAVRLDKVHAPAALRAAG